MKVFLYYFFFFFLYSVFGYICECIYCSIYEKRMITNRGFLLGPYLPIYGFGAMLINLLLNKFVSNPIILFVIAGIISTLLEYFTSYIMEKIFNARWWDYSNKKLNINGRVCFENTFYFALGGIFLMYVLNPFFTSIVNRINALYLEIGSSVILAIFSIDVLITISTMFKLKQNYIIINKNFTDELRQDLPKIIYKSKFLKRRMLNAFPDVRNINVYNKISEIIKTKK